MSHYSDVMEQAYQEYLNKQSKSQIVYTKYEVLERLHDNSYFTYVHSKSLRNYMMGYAVLQGKTEEEAITMANVGLYHDCGKINHIDSVNSSAISIPGTSQDVLQDIRGHVSEGLIYIEGLTKEEFIGKISHHMKFDKKSDGLNSGYYGFTSDTAFTAEEIPDMYKALTVCDIADAIMRERSYKPSKLIGAAINGLNKDADAGEIDRQAIKDVFPALVIVNQLDTYSQINSFTYQEWQDMIQVYNKLLEDNPELNAAVENGKYFTLIDALKKDEELSNKFKEEINGCLKINDIDGEIQPKNILEVVYHKLDEKYGDLDIEEYRRTHTKNENGREIIDYSDLLKDISLNIEPELADRCDFSFRIEKKTNSPEADHFVLLECKDKESGEIYCKSIDEKSLNGCFSSFITAEDVAAADREQTLIGYVLRDDIMKINNQEKSTQESKVYLESRDVSGNDIFHIKLTEDNYDSSTLKVSHNGTVIGNYQIEGLGSDVSSEEIKDKILAAVSYCEKQIEEANKQVLAANDKNSKEEICINELKKVIDDRLERNVYSINEEFLEKNGITKNEASKALAESIVKDTANPLFNEVQPVQEYIDILNGKGLEKIKYSVRDVELKGNIEVKHQDVLLIEKVDGELKVEPIYFNKGGQADVASDNKHRIEIDDGGFEL